MTQISAMKIAMLALAGFANLSYSYPNPIPNPEANYALAARETPATPSSSNNPGLAGNGQGKQFITGLCSSDADCASGCCGFHSALCAGAIIAQERDGGCGFGDVEPNDTAAKALGFEGSPPSSSSSSSSATNSTKTSSSEGSTSSTNAAGQFDNPGAAGNKAGKQFITGLCTSDADCASQCCGFNTGLCAGPVIAQTRDGGCGFGDAQPNDTAAKAFLGE